MIRSIKGKNALFPDGSYIDKLIILIFGSKKDHVEYFLKACHPIGWIFLFIYFQRTIIYKDKE